MKSNHPDTHTDTNSDLSSTESFISIDCSPGLLVAHAPPGTLFTDRCLISGRLIVGRSGKCDLTVKDAGLSSQHFRISVEGSEVLLEDLHSTNGTYVDGFPAKGGTLLEEQTVIRAGRCIFVFSKNAGPLMGTLPAERYGMDGRFFTPGLLRQYEEAAVSGRNILLSGETGTGKELAAQAIAGMMNHQDRRSLHVFNAARFASREEAASTLFGVVPRFFSNVDARAGLIESANNGVLFIDEIHTMSEENQRMLLRVMENNEVSRLGETILRKVNVRFILASNERNDTSGLAPDLFSRLREVTLPPLNSRTADVPHIFKSILKNTLENRGLDADSVMQFVTTNHLEALCLKNYENKNIRALVDLADRISTRIIVTQRLKEAVLEVFGEHFGNSIVAWRRNGSPKAPGMSHYEQNKDLIIAAFRENRSKLGKTEETLKSRGIQCSRRWLAVFLEKWGEKKTGTLL